MLAESGPYVVKLDPDLARRAATDPRISSLVEALVGVAHRVGTHLLAPGIGSEEQLAHLPEPGVRLVPGPPAARPGGRPGVRVTGPAPVPHADPQSARPGR